MNIIFLAKPGTAGMHVSEAKPLLVITVCLPNDLDCDPVTIDVFLLNYKEYYFCL